MKKYEENYAELLEKKSFKEAESLRGEMKNLKQTISEMEIYLSLKFENPENNELIMEVFTSQM